MALKILCFWLLRLISSKSNNRYDLGSIDCTALSSHLLRLYYFQNSDKVRPFATLSHQSIIYEQGSLNLQIHRIVKLLWIETPFTYTTWILGREQSAWPIENFIREEMGSVSFEIINRFCGAIAYEDVGRMQVITCTIVIQDWKRQK
jgi:hypothetical protein